MVRPWLMLSWVRTQRRASAPDPADDGYAVGSRDRASMGDEAALDGGGFDRFLQLFEGAHLDLAHALARDAVLLRQILEGGRVVAQTPLGQDMALTVVQMGHRLFEQVASQPELLALAEPGLLAFALIDEPVLPLPFTVAP